MGNPIDIIATGVAVIQVIGSIAFVRYVSVKSLPNTEYYD